MSRITILLLVCINIAINSIDLGSCDSPALECLARDNRQGPIGKLEVQFHLDTKEGGYSEMKTNSELAEYLKKRKFNPKLRTTVLVHGFLNGHQTGWVSKMRDKLLNREPQNVIVVDWSVPDENNLFDYYSAATSTKPVAESIRDLFLQISEVIKKDISQWKYLHFVGHSLGAHIVGQAARLLKKEHFIVHRVTGLDPAYPCFESDEVPLRLRKSDAKFVDVIHTNSVGGINPNFGIYEPLGHIDFYPNGGSKQPKCYSKEGRLNKEFLINKLSSVLKIFVHVDVNNLVREFVNSKGGIACDHNIAPDYFTESLKSSYRKDMVGRKVPLTNIASDIDSESRKCEEDCVPMGIDAELYTKRPGVYYVDVPANDSEDE